MNESINIQILIFNFVVLLTPTKRIQRLIFDEARGNKLIILLRDNTFQVFDLMQKLPYLSLQYSFLYSRV